MTDEPKKGFTIIEVVLVLAIAGLIFAVVFAAFPRVQRSRRDSERKNDLASIAGELEFFQSSNRGSYPEDDAEIIALIDAKGGDFVDPSTQQTYSSSTSFALGSPPSSGNPGVVYYSDGAKCNDDNSATETSGFNRTYALIMKLEAGYHCIDL